MLHYAHGKKIVGDASTFSNVIHVHQKCIDWSPQVYHKEDEIKYLELELVGAAKLKCSTCEQKGAALGCFVKSCRRNYHLPCALNLDCRWDSVDFLMLCPIHKSIKFPREKRPMSRKHAGGEKQPVPTQMISKNPNFEETSPNVRKEWVLCGSALCAEEKHCLFTFASSCGANVSRCWTPNVTHVIAATDGNGACTRTLEFLMAILNGRWIVTMDWIKACIVAKQPVDEKPYGVKLDNHGVRDGPETGRFMTRCNLARKLFTGKRFYFDGDHFLPAYKNDLVNLIITGGGTVIKRRGTVERICDIPDDEPLKNPIIIFNDDPRPQCAFDKQRNIVFERLQKARDLAKMTACLVIKPSWILDSIAACKLQPVPCSGDYFWEDSYIGLYRAWSNCLSLKPDSPQLGLV